MGRIEASHTSREQHLVQIAERLSERHEAELAVRGTQGQCGGDSHTVLTPVTATERAQRLQEAGRGEGPAAVRVPRGGSWAPLWGCQRRHSLVGALPYCAQLDSFVGMLARLQGGQQQRASHMR